MGYFKYYEDIVEAQEEAKYFKEATEAFSQVFIDKKVDKRKQKFETIFMRYFVLNKIIYELTYKINLMNALLDLKSSCLLNFLKCEKYEYKKNQVYLLEKSSELSDYLIKEDFNIEIVPPLTSLDKHRIRKNLCELIINYVFTYMNESKYMDVKELISDIDALSYWAEKSEDGLLTYSNPGFVKVYINNGEFIKRKCIHCDEQTPNECCYCLNCGSLIGVD